jgi:ankyrin repeat protein
METHDEDPKSKIAFINAVDNDGNTPLHEAYGAQSMFNDTREVADYLLENGADPNVLNNNGKRPDQLSFSLF